MKQTHCPPGLPGWLLKKTFCFWWFWHLEKLYMAYRSLPHVPDFHRFACLPYWRASRNDTLQVMLHFTETPEVCAPHLTKLLHPILLNTGGVFIPSLLQRSVSPFFSFQCRNDVVCSWLFRCSCAIGDHQVTCRKEGDLQAKRRPNFYDHSW